VEVSEEREREEKVLEMKHVPRPKRTKRRT
jgi:hypothetical protein